MNFALASLAPEYTAGIPAIEEQLRNEGPTWTFTTGTLPFSVASRHLTRARVAYFEPAAFSTPWASTVSKVVVVGSFSEDLTSRWNSKRSPLDERPLQAQARVKSGGVGRRRGRAYLLAGSRR